MCWMWMERALSIAWNEMLRRQTELGTEAEMKIKWKSDLDLDLDFIPVSLSLSRSRFLLLRVCAVYQHHILYWHWVRACHKHASPSIVFPSLWFAARTSLCMVHWIRIHRSETKGRERVVCFGITEYRTLIHLNQFQLWHFFVTPQGYLDSWNVFIMMTLYHYLYHLFISHDRNHRHRRCWCCCGSHRDCIWHVPHLRRNEKENSITNKNQLLFQLYIETSCMNIQVALQQSDITNFSTYFRCFPSIINKSKNRRMK